MLADDDETRRNRWIECIQGQIISAHRYSILLQNFDGISSHQSASFSRDDNNLLSSRCQTFLHIRSRRRHLLDLSLEAEAK